MSGKGVIGSIIGSVVCSVLIMSALVYFMAPVLFPIPPDRDVVLQYKYGEWNTPSYIYDNQLTYQKMDDTELSITIDQDSRLYVEFSALALMSLDTSFTVRSSYNISLLVSGVANCTKMILYYDGQPATGFYRELTFYVYIDLLTDPLPAGIYTIEVYWRSTFDASGTFNSLSVAHAPTYNYTRTLFVQELSSF